MSTTRTRKRKVTTMSEQTTENTNIKTVQSHSLNLTLISRDALWNDMRNRTKLHNYEVGEAVKDLRSMVTWTRSKFAK